MSETVSARDGAKLFAVRVAIGLVQGLCLLWLYRTRAVTPALVAPALAMTAALVPIVALGSLGRLSRAWLVAWLVSAAALTFGLGLYIGHVYPKTSPGADAALGLPWVFILAAALFILHHLITASAAERRWRASYERYFDESWLDGVRIGLSAAFVGALWLLLFLGAALFKLIGVKVLETLIREDWFAFPITTTAFAVAIHLTDVRVQLVRGARTLALALLSWLLPILAGLVAAFLLTVPFTGLKPLWDSVSATATMLAVSAAFVVLINAVYQDGSEPAETPLALRWAARLAGVLLAPMVLIAAYSLALRIGQHGLSPARICAAAAVGVAGVYAAGYLVAAVRRGPWLKPLETTNWVAAQVAVAVIVLMLSPVLDPARLSVGDQIRRLTDGRIAPAHFDYKFLHFQSGRWGRKALSKLARGEDASQEIAAAAQKESASADRWSDRKPTVAKANDRAGTIQAVGAPLPNSFFSQAWGEALSEKCPVKGTPCQAVTGELDGQPGAEIVLISAYEDPSVYALRTGRWVEIGRLSGVSCPGDVRAIMARQFRFAPAPTAQALFYNGRARVLIGESDCPQEPPPR